MALSVFLRVFTGFCGFLDKLPGVKLFLNYRKNLQNQNFPHWADEFWCRIRWRFWFCYRKWPESKSWRRYERQSHCQLVSQQIIPLHGIRTVINDVEVYSIQISNIVFRCEIRWRFWFCHQTWPDSKIWRRYERSKSKLFKTRHNTSRVRKALNPIWSKPMDIGGRSARTR